MTGKAATSTAVSAERAGIPEEFRRVQWLFNQRILAFCIGILEEPEKIAELLEGIKE